MAINIPIKGRVPCNNCIQIYKHNQYTYYYCSSSGYGCEQVFCVQNTNMYWWGVIHQLLNEKRYSDDNISDCWVLLREFLKKTNLEDLIRKKQTFKLIKAIFYLA